VTSTDETRRAVEARVEKAVRWDRKCGFFVGLDGSFECNDDVGDIEEGFGVGVWDATRESELGKGDVMQTRRTRTVCCDGGTWSVAGRALHGWRDSLMAGTAAVSANATRQKRAEQAQSQINEKGDALETKRNENEGGKEQQGREDISRWYLQ
jgi:hypothetical protein